MIGGTVETSASYEARYAPLSYPTADSGDAEPAMLARLDDYASSLTILPDAVPAAG
jgi:hypothetical protein